MSALPEAPSDDFRGPVGNNSDKYGTRNPLARRLLAGFLGSVDGVLDRLAPTSVLDVGCGEGVVSERIAGRLTGAQVVGIDSDTPELEAEWRRRAGPNLTFRAGSAYSLSFPDDSFDVVCALEVLEHLEDPRRALGEIVRVARRGVIVSVPHEPVWRLVHVLAGRDVRRLGNTPGHINHWGVARFRRLVEGYARVEDVRTPFPWILVVADPRGRG